MINWDLLAAYVAIGALSELISLRNTSPGHQVATGAGMLVSGFALALIIPPTVNNYMILGFFAAAFNRLSGRFLGDTIDRLRIWLDGKKRRQKSARAKPGHKRQ